jgi:hypothetical protein
LATVRAIEVQQLTGQVWVASRSGPGDTLLGVWPGLAERSDIRYVVRDWLAKLQIVAARDASCWHAAPDRLTARQPESPTR